MKRLLSLVCLFALLQAATELWVLMILLISDGEISFLSKLIAKWKQKNLLPFTSSFYLYDCEWKLVHDKFLRSNQYLVRKKVGHPFFPTFPTFGELKELPRQSCDPKLSGSTPTLCQLLSIISRFYRRRYFLSVLYSMPSWIPLPKQCHCEFWGRRNFDSYIRIYYVWQFQILETLDWVLLLLCEHEIPVKKSK